MAIRPPPDRLTLCSAAGSVLPRGKQPDVAAAWEVVSDNGYEQMVEALTLFRDCTCKYEYKKVQVGIGGQEVRRMGTWMVAQGGDGSTSFKVMQIAECELVGNLAAQTLRTPMGNTLTRTL